MSTTTEIDHGPVTPYVDPASKPVLEVDRLLAQGRELPFRMRALFTIDLLIGTMGWGLVSSIRAKQEVR